MKISFEHISQTPYTGKAQEASKPQKGVKSAQAACYQANDKSAQGITPFAEQGKKTMQDIMDTAGHTDVQTQQDKMTLLSNTVSEEDYKRLSEEGFDLSQMDPKEAVTILDKIKAELIKSGKSVVGFTDDISMEALAGALGSEGLARQLTQAFAEADIPVNTANVQKAVMAVEVARTFTPITKEAMAFMAGDGMQPTLRNLLVAKSGVFPVASMQGAYFGEEIKGYVTKNVEGGNGVAEEMNTQIERIAAQWNEKGENASVSAEEIAFLTMQGVAVTEETLASYTALRSVTFPIDNEKLLKSVAVAIAEGKDIYDADLAQDKTVMQEASDIYHFYMSENATDKIKDRRILEEIRLVMTVEVNRKLLESGFQIDTAPMEDVVEALKQAEAAVAKSYFADSVAPTEDYRLWNQATKIIREIPTLPAQTVPMFMERMGETSPQQIYDNGSKLANAFAEAMETYETIGTAPRADLGDRIGKAFVSVDSLLHDLSYPTTPENQKAVRALAYHEMEITAQNIERVKQAEEKLLTVVHKMTPASVLKMIRDGVNPLTTDLDSLNAYLQEQDVQYDKEAKGYAQFLHQLDKTNGISEAERESFIGIYRMLRQIEKADGSAVSGIVNTGAQLNFATLLSAVRSGKYKGMDVKVTDEVGALAERVSTESSISEQIAKGYSDTAKELMQAAKAPQEAYTLLEKGGMPQTAENVAASTGFLENPKKTLERLRIQDTAKDYRKLLAEGDAFAESYDSEISECMEAVQEETFACQNTIDVREHQLLHKQLNILTGLSQKKEYYFSAPMNEENALVHLRLEDGEGQALVEMTVESSKIGTLQGYLNVQGDNLTGYFVGNKKDVVMNLQNSADIEISTDGKEWSLRRVEFIYSETGKASLSSTGKSENERVSSKQLYQIAAGFLDAVAHVGNMIS